MSKAYYKIENKSKTGAMEIEVEVINSSNPHGKNMVTIKPVAGEGEMKVWSSKVVVRNDL